MLTVARHAATLPYPPGHRREGKPQTPCPFRTGSGLPERYHATRRATTCKPWFLRRGTECRAFATAGGPPLASAVERPVRSGVPTGKVPHCQGALVRRASGPAGRLGREAIGPSKDSEPPPDSNAAPVNFTAHSSGANHMSICSLCELNAGLARGFHFGISTAQATRSPVQVVQVSLFQPLNPGDRRAGHRNESAIGRRPPVGIGHKIKGFVTNF